MIVLENKLGIKNQLELNRVEERLSKMKIKDLYDPGEINCIEVGTFKGLSDITNTYMMIFISLLERFERLT